MVCAVVNKLETDSRNIRSKYGGIRNLRKVTSLELTW